MALILNGTSGITDVNGTAAAPAITGTDTDTGVFFGTNTVSLSTGGTERLQVDSSGNLGLGVTPSSWISTFKALQVSSGAAFQGQTNSVSIAHVSGNAYVDSGGTYRYIGTGEAAQRYQQYQGAHSWYTAASGTAGNAISFTQAMTLDASGNWGLGTTSPTSFGGGYTVGQINGSSGGYLLVSQAGTTSIGEFGTDSSLVYIGSRSTNTPIVFRQNGSNERARIDSSGNWVFPYGWLKNSPDGATPSLGIGTSDTGMMFIGGTPKRIIPRTQANSASDNQIDLGDAGSRYKTLYAGTGTINTSDAREKTVVTPLTEDELAAASQIAASVGTYQWLQAVEEKGAAARHHAGLTVQRAIEIMEANNLNPFAYGFICYDSWAEETDAEGAVTKAAGDRYSFRMDELSLFIARGQQAIITQLQADIETLKGKA